MSFLETFVAAGIAGFGFLLAVVALLAWKRTKDAKMAALCAAFAAQGLGGALMLLEQLVAGPFAGVGALSLACGTLAGLVLLYAALFARRA